MTSKPQAYVICATPRSGSTLLCSLLAATRVAGRPNSFFRSQSRPEWAHEWGLPAMAAVSDRAFTRRYVDAMRKEGTAQTGVFGLRIIAENIRDASAVLDQLYPGLPNDRARYDAAFGKTVYIHLTRQDQVAQAVSLIKARQSGLWHVAPDGSELERLSPAKPVDYNAGLITRQIAEYQAAERAWQYWFVGQKITPLRLTYEGLATAPFDTLTDVLRHLGLSPSAADGVAPGVAPLADAVSREWIARYRRAEPDV
tara:strand:- start:9556 stop:10320 length:765 start_codon:yes stop_codon:yes gene_type:complete